VQRPIRVDGKQFKTGREVFRFRGVTYGTFQPRDDGAHFPEPHDAKLDFASMRETGFTVVRTYTVPPDDVIELAADLDLYLLTDVFYPDWRYLIGTSRRERRRMVEGARREVRSVARRLRDAPAILGLSLGNEVPADVVRWFGTDAVAGLIRELAEVVREEDPERLVTYGNYPTTEYLPLDCLDFLTFNVFLEDRVAFRRYVTRLHHLAGDRPIVLGEIGLNSGEGLDGECRQAQAIEWQLATALERGVAGTCLFSWTDEWWVAGGPVEGWHFGLTRTDRSPRPALDVAARWNHRTVRDLPFDWPSITVVICAYNAEKTLDECLAHTCALDYPMLEILVVDDGSTDATARIAAGYPRARLLSIPHAGLSAARNEGLRAASGDLVAYLDSDAYPSRDWPYYLALGIDSPVVGGVGGPNIPPPSDPPGAHRVAQAPGGPMHVLLSDDRAEHVPGCNMAFWKQVLVETGGFDPVYTSAGDDVDLCWRVLDRGWEIAFHPAAFVWHHRRSRIKPYLQQQRGYGRSEALVEARHPDRFTWVGTARWRGSIYGSGVLTSAGQRIYRGPFGMASFQSVYRSGGTLRDLVHQVGVPVASALVATGPLAVLSPTLGLPAVVAMAALLVLFILGMRSARPPHDYVGSRLGFRAGVALLHLLQPMARAWGRAHYRGAPRNNMQHGPSLPGTIRDVDGTTLLMPAGGRAELSAAFLTLLRRSGWRITVGSGWEDYDARVIAGPFIFGDVLSSNHPHGCTQLRVRRRVRWTSTAVVLAVITIVAFLDLLAAVLVLAMALVETGREFWRTGGALSRALRGTAR
jgi:GT2 family glycosyltransferase